jgi:hypothetical protein
MKAFLIDPTAKTVTETDFVGDFREIQKVIDVDMFTVIRISPDNIMYLDDEGLYVEDQKFFAFKGYPQNLAGKALILGDKDGDSADSTLTLEQVINAVTFDAEPVDPSFTILSWGA